MAVPTGHPFGGSLSEESTADCVAVLLRCTTPGVAAKPLTVSEAVSRPSLSLIRASTAVKPSMDMTMKSSAATTLSAGSFPKRAAP